MVDKAMVHSQDNGDAALGRCQAKVLDSPDVPTCRTHRSLHAPQVGPYKWMIKAPYDEPSAGNDRFEHCTMDTTEVRLGGKLQQGRIGAGGRAIRRAPAG
jgi:hypothetical protein